MQLHKDNNILNALVYPDTPLEKITERNISIDEVAAQLEELEQKPKNFTNASMEFWGNFNQHA